MLDSLVRVSRRVEWEHYTKQLEQRAPFAGYAFYTSLSALTLPQKVSLADRPVLQPPPLEQVPWRNRVRLDILLTMDDPSQSSDASIGYTRRRASGTSSVTQCASLIVRSTTAQSMRKLILPLASFSTISDTFNSLFKVLFIFSSQYLYAIGIELVFSFR